MVYDRPARVELKGVEFGLIPYFRTAEAWAAAAEGMEGVTVLWCHQSFDGCRVPGYVFRAGQHAETVGEGGIPRVGAIGCGHIHLRQRFMLGGVDVVMPGATERTSFVEREQTKGYAIWEIGPTIQARFVALPSRRMVVLLHLEDLAQLQEGDLVKLPPEAPEFWEQEVIARGGWVVPRKKPSRQVGLFGRGKRDP